MHEPIRSQLEDILRGRLNPSFREAVETHLAECPPCSAELGAMRLHSGLVRSLKISDCPDPSAGFYARVVQRIETQSRPSFWNLLLDPVFGRRLVYATASLFLFMAAFLLASSGEQPELAQTPVQLIARPISASAAVRANLDEKTTDFGEDMQRNREHFLVTMASFSD